MKSGIANRFIAPLMVSLFCIAGGNAAHAVGGNSTNGEWEFTLAPLFLWAQGIQGDTQVGPTTTPLDIEFKDALDNLEATFTVHYEMKRDALTLFAEYQYVDLGPEAYGPMNTELNVDYQNWIGELGAAYWVYGTDRTNWEVLGGARYTKQELDVSVKNGPDLLSTDEGWWVGFFGGRFSAQLSKNWSFISRADFGIGSGKTNRIWNLDAMFNYRFKDWGSVFAGYKYMNYDYENSDRGKSHYAYDASQQGPLLGLNFHW